MGGAWWLGVRVPRAFFVFGVNGKGVNDCHGKGTEWDRKSVGWERGDFLTQRAREGRRRREGFQGERYIGVQRQSEIVRCVSCSLCLCVNKLGDGRGEFLKRRGLERGRRRRGELEGDRNIGVQRQSETFDCVSCSLCLCVNKHGRPYGSVNSIVLFSRTEF